MFKIANILSTIQNKCDNPYCTYYKKLVFIHNSSSELKSSCVTINRARNSLSNKYKF